MKEIHADQPTRRVLIVDDNVDAAELLRLLLDATGHAVEVAHDGGAAVQLVEQFQPEVVLLDLGLPDMDGCEVAQRIRLLPTGKDVRLIAVTGWGQDEDRARTRKAGFDEHLTKPVDRETLLSALS